jgi:3D (Asp-Asp-Asp) domain-containing protein
VDEGGLPYTVRTTAQTVGEALREAEITLCLGDRVEPSLGSAVTTGLRVLIERSTPLSIYADGRQHRTRTRADTVADALSAMGVVLAGLDRVEPTLDTALYPGINIAVTRVHEEIEVEEQIEPFETVFEPDANLPIDTQQVVNAGAEGITRQRSRVIYENGEEVSRVLEDEWLAQAPDMRRIAYGQQITPQTAVVDGVPITYWRKVRMLATSYNAESAGGNITRTGDALRDAVVAVDPRIIPLRSQVFVPGYGQADALDTGGGIISRRIDLAYVNRPWQSWSRWVDVYLLWPPPPAGNITWVIPNFPRVPGS